MKEQLELLEELNEIDNKIGEIEKDMEAFPVEMEKEEAVLGEEEAVVAEIRDTLEAQEKEKRDKDDELSASGERLTQFEGRLHEIKTNTEYQASLKEIEQAKKQNVALEEEILVLMEMIEENSGKVSAAQAEFNEKKAKVETKIKNIEAKKAEEQKILDKILKERKEKSKIIDAKVFQTYENLKAKLKRNILVRNNNGSCSGCYLHIPPQLINNAMKHEDIYQCPHCHRLLIVH